MNGMLPPVPRYIASRPKVAREAVIIDCSSHAASEPATIRLRWKGAAAKEAFEIKPKLYVLAVGVSMYQDPDMRLDLAAKDALDFGAAWNEQKGRLYSGVEVRALTDAQATKGNILDGLEWLQRQVTAKDIETDAEVEILNPDLHIATIDKNGKLEFEVRARRGRGRGAR